MRTHQRVPFVTAVVLALLTTALPGQDARQNAEDADRLARALQLQAGSVVGEVGAGDGSLTLAIAKVVGASGRVFSNEISGERLAHLRKATAASSLRNVAVVEASQTDTNFPHGSCDAIFMRDVYHHLSDPVAMNASLFRSLKPGGRLAVLDFGPPPGAERVVPAERARDGHHGVTPATLERELTSAGFEILATTSYGFRNFMIVARRPDSGPDRPLV
jgi:ubiquinone/menaquinone biosynthesis C-methylase UbiE